jgi:hypothetical protein
LHLPHGGMHGLLQLRIIDNCSPALPGNSFPCSSAAQSLEEINPAITYGIDALGPYVVYIYER